MVYGAEAVLPCDIIHDSPRVRMYEEREAELDRQDSLDALEEERGVAKSLYSLCAHFTHTHTIVFYAWVFQTLTQC